MSNFSIMYWLDIGSLPRIQQANMDDGRNRQALISTDLALPNGLAIDFTCESMYKKLETFIG